MTGRSKRGAVKNAVLEEDEPLVKKGKQSGNGSEEAAVDEAEVEEVEGQEELEVKEEPEGMEEGDDAAVSEKVSKRRGRARKVNKEEVDEGYLPLASRTRRLKQEINYEEIDESQMEKKRGRKRGPAKEVIDKEEKDAAPLIEKGKRKAATSKPNKDTVMDEEDVEENVVPATKGRGRPKTAKQKEEVETEEAAPEVKKGRKKVAASKPKQNVEAEEEDEVTPPVVRKGRRQAAAKQKQDKDDEEEGKAAAPVVKKGGRRPAAAKQKQDEDEEEPTPPGKKGKKRAPAAPKQRTVDKADQTFVVTKKDSEDVQPSSSTLSKNKKKETGLGKNTKPKAAKKDSASKTSTAGGKENTDTHNLPGKSGVKTGVERKLVVKGRAAVDALCPIAEESHVYEEDGDIWDCMLNQTNIQFNNNKFYLIQLLKDDSSTTYSVWMRWGRVGANGQMKLFPCASNLEKAKDIFEKKFRDKTTNEWFMKDMFEKVPGKYDLLKMDYSKGNDTPDSAAIVKKAKERTALECKLHPVVRAIIELICDVKCMEEAVLEMKYDAEKAPLGKLTTDQIKAGYLALKRIDDLVESGKFVTKDLVQACNDFYTRVPHYFGMKVPPLIRTKADIQEKVALLEALGDIQAALSVLDQPIDVNTHPTDHHYRNLKCDLTPLDRNSPEYSTIETYMMTTHARTHCQYKLQLLEVLVCHKESEYQRFKNVGNRMLLWHGSRMSNWAGILSQGLRIAPPEAPVTGYMFGKGIYFADMASKSANYCWASAGKDVGFLMLSEVALGKSNELFHADYNANKLPPGYHSVKGCGRTAPQPENFSKLSDGTVVPLGPGVDNTGKGNGNYCLLYNEYIVYDPAQVRTRFLLKVRFIFN